MSKTVESFSFGKMKSLYPCPPRNNWCVKKYRVLIASWFWIIFEPLPPPNLWNGLARKVHQKSSEAKSSGKKKLDVYAYLPVGKQTFHGNIKNVSGSICSHMGGIYKAPNRSPTKMLFWLPRPIPQRTLINTALMIVKAQAFLINHTYSKDTNQSVSFYSLLGIATSISIGVKFYFLFSLCMIL